MMLLSQKSRDIAETPLATLPWQQQLLNFHVHFILGCAKSALKKFKKAKGHLETSLTALERLEQIDPGNQKDWMEKEIAVWFKMAKNFNHFEGRTDDAMECLEKILKISDESAEKFANENKIAALHEMAKMDVQLDNQQGTDIALQRCQLAYDLASESCTPEEPSKSLGDACRMLAEIHNKMENNEEAESYYREACAAYRGSLGQNNRATLRCQETFVNFLCDIEETEIAIEILEPLIPFYYSVFGLYSAQSADANKLLATMLLHRGKADQAVDPLNKCLEIQTMIYGKSSKRTISTQEAIDVLSKGLENENSHGSSLLQRHSSMRSHSESFRF